MADHEGTSGNRWLVPKILLACLGSLVILTAVYFGLDLVVQWIVRFARAARPVTVVVNQVALAVTFLVLAPMAFFRSRRQTAGEWLVLVSYAVGISLWLTSVQVAYSIWGKSGLLVGLMLLGVGVVPVAFVAVLIHGRWTDVLALAIAIAFWSLTRAAGTALTAPPASPQGQPASP